MWGTATETATSWPACDVSRSALDGAGSGAWGLSPEDVGRVPLDLGEGVVDVARGRGEVVVVEAEVCDRASTTPTAQWSWCSAGGRSGACPLWAVVGSPRRACLDGRQVSRSDVALDAKLIANVARNAGVATAAHGGRQSWGARGQCPGSHLCRAAPSRGYARVRAPEERRRSTSRGRAHGGRSAGSQRLPSANRSHCDSAIRGPYSPNHPKRFSGAGAARLDARDGGDHRTSRGVGP